MILCTPGRGSDNRATESCSSRAIGHRRGCKSRGLSPPLVAAQRGSSVYFSLRQEVSQDLRCGRSLECWSRRFESRCVLQCTSVTCLSSTQRAILPDEVQLRPLEFPLACRSRRSLPSLDCGRLSQPVGYQAHSGDLWFGASPICGHSPAVVTIPAPADVLRMSAGFVLFWVALVFPISLQRGFVLGSMRSNT